MKWFEVGDGQTLLDADERAGLRLPAMTRGELDELEQANITDALRWAYGRKALAEDLLHVTGLLALHRRMFGDVWTWAGALRTTEKNIGVAPHAVAAEVKKACDDMTYWLDQGAVDPREAAALYHHRLVRVHPFANGNGRLARVTADLLVYHRGAEGLHWPTDRQAYIVALREADARHYDRLKRLLLDGAD